MAIKKLEINFNSDELELKDFLAQLDAVKAALNRLEEFLTDDQNNRIKYKIVGLSLNSPARITLQAESNNEFPNYVVDAFTRAVRQVQTGENPNVPLNILDALRRIGPKKHSINEVTFSTNNATVSVRENMVSQIDKVLGDRVIVLGSMTGKLDLINLHRKTEFRIYPTIGIKSVACTFDKSLFEKVKLGIGEYVEVSGEITY